jgi:hypothetical protein
MNPVVLVTTLVAAMMNGRQFERLDELCDARLAPNLRAAFEQLSGLVRLPIRGASAVHQRGQCAGHPTQTVEVEDPDLLRRHPETCHANARGQLAAPRLACSSPK